MAFRYFPGASLKWLESKLTQLNEEDASVAPVTGGGAGDVTYSGQVQASVATTKRKVLHDLSVLDPVTYPTEQVIGARVVQGVFADP